MVVPAITDLDMDTFDEKKDSQAASPRGVFSELVFYWEGKNLEEKTCQKIECSKGVWKFEEV